MTQDEIIEMARQAGLTSIDKKSAYLRDCLERFAKLVAAKEREKLKNVAIFDRWYQELDAAVLAEREACAKVCEELPAPDIYNDTDQSMWDVTCMDCSTAIRARGEA